MNYHPCYSPFSLFSVKIRDVNILTNKHSQSAVDSTGSKKAPVLVAEPKGIFGILLIILLLAAASGCGFQQFPEHLSSAILNQPDPETVREAVPAYLVMIDTFIEGDPDNVKMLRAGASMYSAYAGMFVDQPERARLLAGRAKDYGARALCAARSKTCGLAAKPFLEFVPVLNGLTKDSVPLLFDYSVSWLVWIKFHSDDWAAVADLPKVQAVLAHVTQLDEGYRQGSAFRYLGILNTLRPPSLGGQPEIGRQHFERAIELSAGRDLGAKVDFAQFYARLVYNRELHDRLLQEVLAAPTEAPDLTLPNTMAQEQAWKLLKSADSYF